MQSILAVVMVVVVLGDVVVYVEHAHGVESRQAAKPGATRHLAH